MIAATACKLTTCLCSSFARRDLTLRQCFLLREIGGCSPASFAGAVFSRRSTDVRRHAQHLNPVPDICHACIVACIVDLAFAPPPLLQSCTEPTEYDNPLCIQLANSR